MDKLLSQSKEKTKILYKRRKEEEVKEKHISRG